MLILGLLALLVLLSPYGLWRYSRITSELKELQAENSRLEQENRELLIEIERLADDPEYIEEMARRQHGLLKENELLFNFDR